MASAPRKRTSYTNVARHFRTKKPIVHLTVPDTPNTTRAGEPRLPRMGFGAPTERYRMTYDALVFQVNTYGGDNAMIFPDTGVISVDLPPQVWSRLSSQIIAFSPMTVAELDGWRSNPFENTYLHQFLHPALEACKELPLEQDHLFRTAVSEGVFAGNTRAFGVSVADRGAFSQFGYDYYLDLLSLRKLRGVQIHRELSKRLARSATKEELSQHLNNKYHPRDSVIGTKGWETFGRRNYLADESLVVTATLSAILTGQNAVILTRDTDVLDQFAKLSELVSGDYFCYCFGEIFFHNRDLSLQTEKLVEGDRFPPGCQGQQVGFCSIPHTASDELWPREFEPVTILCFLIGDDPPDLRVSKAAFRAEREVQEMLTTKTTTCGKNSSRFGNRNIASLQHPEKRTEAMLFVIAEECQEEFEGVSVSWLDRDRALLSASPLFLKTIVS